MKFQNFVPRETFYFFSKPRTQKNVPRETYCHDLKIKIEL
jgi:hypothetical protein